MPIRPSPLSTAIQLALALGFSHSVTAQPFPAEIELSELDGTNGFMVDGAGFQDEAGTSVSGLGDINGDGFDDVIIGALLADPDGRTDAGLSVVVFGTDTGFESPLPLFSLTDGSNGIFITGETPNDETGTSVSGIGDFNNDGIDDLIIGAPYAEPSGTRSGRSYIVFGSDSSLMPLDLLDLDGSNGFAINAEFMRDLSGFSVSSAGDINADGIDDVIVGSPGSNQPAEDAGRSYVIFGTSAPFSASFDLDNLNGLNGFALNGVVEYDRSGISVSAAGDINGDGIDDLIIGASRADPNGDRSGSSYVVYGSASTPPNPPFPNPFLLSSLDGSNGFAIHGDSIGDYSGISVGSAGDINGDGFDDLFVGAFGASTSGPVTGVAYLIFGSDGGFTTPFELSSINGFNGIAFSGEDELDYAGSAISAAGDVNGDGLDDLIIGAFTANPNGNDSGRAYVVFGSPLPLGSPFQLSNLNGSNGFALNGEGIGFLTGRSVTGAGDVNGDGIDDIAIGAPAVDTKYSDASGRSYVVFGRPSIDLAITKTNGQSLIDPEGSVTYIIDVNNPGPVNVTGAILNDTLPSTLNSATASWSCDIAVGTTCPNASGTGNLNEVVDLPVGSSLSYSITANVIAEEGELIINTATINLPGELVDADPSDNSATDSDPTGLFADSFETEV